MTYEEAEAIANDLYDKYLNALEYARKIHNHTWEQRVTWGQYCPGCGDTNEVKGPIDEKWLPEDGEDDEY